MSAINLQDAMAVLDWIEGNPDLPPVFDIAHSGHADYADSRVFHSVHLDHPCGIREALAWHDALTDAHIRGRDVADQQSVFLQVYGLLPTGQGLHVIAACTNERQLLLHNLGLPVGGRLDLIEVGTLRRLVDAQLAEGVPA